MTLRLAKRIGNHKLGTITLRHVFSQSSPTTLGPLLVTVAPLAMFLTLYDIVCLTLIRPAAQSMQEIVTAALALVLISVITIMLALLEVGLFAVYRFIGRHTNGILSSLIPALLAALVASPLVYLIAKQPFIGNRYGHTAAALYGPPILFGILTITGVVSLALAIRAGLWLLAQRPTRVLPALCYLTLLLVSSLLVWLDTFWQVGWYPAVHVLFAVATTLLVHTLLALLTSHSAAIKTIALRLTCAMVVSMAVALPLVWFYGTTLTRWRVATSTVFASHALVAFSWTATPSPSLGELTDLPDIDLRPLLARPAVLGTPEALASNGFLITVDALRFDAVGPHSTRATLTPNIDAFFAQGQLFHRAYANYASTRYSLRALLEGRVGSDPNEDAKDNLIARLRDYGYQVIGILPNDLKLFTAVERYSFTRIAFYDNSSDTVPLLRATLRDLPPGKRFIWVHLYQPHDPYDPIPPYRKGSSQKERYDGEVRWVDDQFKSIVDEFADSDHLVVFSADHGEEFGEHGGTLHGRTGYEETLHVPLHITAPGLKPAKRVDLVANVDLAPTILAALGVPLPDVYEGYDLFGRASRAPQDRVLYAETVTNRTVAWRGTRKWIHWPDRDYWELYDLVSDPLERNNLADVPGAVSEGRALLSMFRLQKLVLPALADVNVDTFARWYTRELETTQRSAARRWAAVQAGRMHLPSDVLRDLFATALEREDDRYIRATLGAALQPQREPIYAPEALGASVNLDTLDPSRDDATLRQLLSHEWASVRSAAAFRLAEGQPQTAIQLATTLSRGDTAALGGVLRGLTANTRPTDLTFIEPFVNHSDSDIRLLAVTRLRDASLNGAKTLRQRADVETSPSVLKAIMDALLGLDRQAGVAAITRDMNRQILSDFDRAELISAWNVTEGAEHLVALFIKHESTAFRALLLKAVTTLRCPRQKKIELMTAMSQHTFDPALRDRINKYLRPRRVKDASGSE